MPVLWIWTREGGVLSAVAPFGPAAAAGTALVIDLDPGGPCYPGSGSLASLVAAGPRRADLEPQRRGVAVLRNGGIDPGRAGEVVDALASGWPAVVLRLSPASLPPPPAVAVASLVPGSLLPLPDDRPRLAVQFCGWRLPAPDGALVLPRISRLTLRRLCEGVMPDRFDRWVRSWRPVWQWAQ